MRISTRGCHEGDLGFLRGRGKNNRDARRRRQHHQYAAGLV